MSDHPHVWYVEGFGVEESDSEAVRAEKAGEEVTILTGDW
jgi:hypothetical protein